MIKPLGLQASNPSPCLKVTQMQLDYTFVCESLVMACHKLLFPILSKQLYRVSPKQPGLDLIQGQLARCVEICRCAHIRQTP